MCSRVCRIYKLSRDVAVWNFFCKFICFCDSTLHSFCTFCQNQFSTISFQDVSTFNAHSLWHGKNDSVAFGCRDRSKTNTCISRCRLNDYRAFLQKPLGLSVLYHRLSYTILDASCRVKVLKLHKYSSLKP